MSPLAIAGIVVASIVVLLALLNMKTSRPDGAAMKKVHKYRKMMAHLMPTKAESIVLFDDYVDAEKLLEYVKAARDRFHCDITHCVVAACAIGVHENPSMNRFVTGRRLYQRYGSWITFSMKRKKMEKSAKVSIAKIRFPASVNFEEAADLMNARINHERSDTKTYVDKELDLFMLFPRPVLKAMINLVKWLNYYNLLPKSFIENDAMFTSMVVANLGSVGMKPGYHHLYEWGTSPLFLMVGKLEERPVVVDGEIVVRKQLHLRYTYDERIDDGLTARFGIEAVRRVLEDPFHRLGCLGEGDSPRPVLYDGPDSWDR